MAAGARRKRNVIDYTGVQIATWTDLGIAFSNICSLSGQANKIDTYSSRMMPGLSQHSIHLLRSRRGHVNLG